MENISIFSLRYHYSFIPLQSDFKQTNCHIMSIRNIFMGILLSFCGTAIADNYAYLNVKQTDTESSFAVADISKITFDASNMIVHLTDNTQQKMPLSSLSKMFFSENGTQGISTQSTSSSQIVIEDGILHVKSAKGNIITLYDLSGKAIFTMTAKENDSHINLKDLLRGAYIVRIGTESKKIRTN